MRRRHVGRARYEPADRAWLAALARLIPRRRWSEVFPVTPATLLAWHRKLAAGKYDTSKRRKPGRPPAIRSIARLAVRLARENRRGDTAASTVSSPSWALRSRRPQCGRSCTPQASIPRRAVRARPGGSSCTPRQPGSPWTIFWARPSTTAVLPTPGSPTSTGLFLVRRHSTCITRSISFSRPITGSSLPSRAAAVRFRPNWSSMTEADGAAPGGAPAAAGSLPGEPASSRITCRRTLPGSAPSLTSTWAATPSPSRIRPSRMCSVPM